MNFLAWHYTVGLKAYLNRWFYVLAYIIHYFSLPLLLSSLFSPWKRLVDTSQSTGFSFTKYFERLTFNIISRGIGFIVRLVLLVFGTFALSVMFILGFFGCVIWTVFPVLGAWLYYTRDPGQKRFLKNLFAQMRVDPASAVRMALNTPAGKFILTHTNLTTSGLPPATPFNLSGFAPQNFSDLLQKFIDLKVWDRDLLRQKDVDYPDLLLGASWWDKKFTFPNPFDGRMRFSKPGIGLELLFGYTPLLNQYVTDLGQPQFFYHHLIGREEIVSRIERTLTSGESVILVGQPGVGKKTIVLEFARRAMAGELSQQMAYKRVLELDYNFLLSEVLDLNQKKNKFSDILAEAAAAGNIILVVKDIHRLTNSEVEGVDFTDIWETHLEKRNLKIIAISSQVDYERFTAPNTRLRKFLVPVEAAPVSVQDALQILVSAADRWETQKPLVITVQALRAIISGSDRYITDIPFPEKALEILDRVVSYAEHSGKKIITTDEVNAVLAETTGISMARLTEHERQLLGNLEEVLHQRLVGQNTAISLIAKSLRARSVGVKDDRRPIGSFLFLGPTGVGKTQTAKSLAQIYYGSTDLVLRFDMAEYAGGEGLARLIGSSQKNMPGALTTAIKNRPASLLLLDEIEKAPPEIYNLFLTLLDEGSITDAFGRLINCRHLFVIATSNAGAEYVRQLVGQKVSAEVLQKSVVDYVQKHNIFSPEFLNRYDGVVVFEPLTSDQLIKIANLQLQDLQKSLEQKNIHLEITPEVCQKLAADGFEPEFGARPMRRIIDISIGDILGRAILSNSIKSGDKICLVPDPKDGYKLEKI